MSDENPAPEVAPTNSTQGDAPKPATTSFFDQMNAVKAMASKKLQETKEIIKDKIDTIFKKEDEIEIIASVCEPTQKGSGISGYTVYKVKGSDKDGEFETLRRYNEFDILRETLRVRWPGCYIPPLPEKKIGSNDKEVIGERTRFLDFFIRQCAQLKHLFYAEEFQLFIRSKEAEITKSFEKFPKPTSTEIYEKYKKVFPDLVNGTSNSEKVVKIQSFSGFIKKTQNSLRGYKDPSSALVASRDQMGAQLLQLNDMFLPEYEQNCLLEYTAYDETRLIMSNPTNQYLAQIKEELKELAQKNAYLEFADLIKVETREIDAFVEAINARDQVELRQNTVKQEIREIEADVAQVSAGGQTMKSMMFKGTPEQFQTLLEEEINAKNKEMESLEALGIFITVLLADKEINFFKKDKEQTYKELLNNISKLELEYYQKQYEYWNEVENLSQKLLKSELN